MSTRFSAIGLVLTWLVTAIMDYALVNNTSLARIVSDVDPRSAQTFTHTSTPAAEIEYLRTELNRAGIVNHQDDATVLAVLKWTMDQVGRIEDNDSDSPKELLTIGRSGRGLLCGGMAFLFHQALQAYGIQARLVYLQRSLTDIEDIHLTVEAWIDGAWRLYDPTFHLSLVQGSKRVGIAEGNSWLVRGTGTPVSYKFLGDVKYPARLETYYISYESLLRNAFIPLEYPHSRMRVAPIIGPYSASGWVPLTRDGTERALFGYQVLQFLGLVALPLLCLVTATLFLLRLRSDRSRQTRTP